MDWILFLFNTEWFTIIGILPCDLIAIETFSPEHVSWKLQSSPAILPAIFGWNKGYHGWFSTSQKFHGPWLWFNLKGYHASNMFKSPCGFQIQTWGVIFWHRNCCVLQAGSESDMVIPRMKPQGLTTPVGTWDNLRIAQVISVDLGDIWWHGPSNLPAVSFYKKLRCWGVFLRGCSSVGFPWATTRGNDPFKWFKSVGDKSCSCFLDCWTMCNVNPGLIVKTLLQN